MIKLITDNLNDDINQLILKSTEIKILTAFLKNSGLQWIDKITHKNIKIISGINFFITDKEALLTLKEKGIDIKVFYDPSVVFHPKCYYFKNENEEYLIVGSSNLTLGGFIKNYEASILIKNDYNNEIIFKDFIKYFDSIYNSKFSINPDNKIFENYHNKYKEKIDSLNKEFLNEINENIYTNEIPVDDINLIKVNDWIWHDKFKIGYTINIKNDNGEFFFIIDGKKILGSNNKMYVIKNLKSNLINDFFTINKMDILEKSSIEFKNNSIHDDWLKKRYDFYNKWRNKLSTSMNSDEIFNFFEEASGSWTLFRLKKNILSEKPEKFNEYLDVLNDNKLSFYERYNKVCEKIDTEKIVDGIGRAITSSILNIININDCSVFNNASDAVLDYFEIDIKSKRGETPADKYLRFTLLSKFLQQKYGFKDLVEVDCFIGYIKTEYINKK